MLLDFWTFYLVFLLLWIFSFSNISGSILDERENCKTCDIEDAVSLFDTSVASECDAEVAEITLGG